MRQGYSSYALVVDSANCGDDLVTKEAGKWYIGVYDCQFVAGFIRR
jgi:hypothetical protein